MTPRNNNKNLFWILIFGIVFSFSKQTNAQYSFEITEISPFPSAVHGMVVDKDSTLYFSDTFTSYGSPSEVYFLEHPYTGSINAIDIIGGGVCGLLWQEDILYVAFLNDSKIKSYDRNFILLDTWNVSYSWNFTSNEPDIYVVTYLGKVMKLNGSSFQRVKEISMDGVILDTIPIVFGNLEGLAMDADTNLYIADTETGEIIQYTKDWELDIVTDAYNLPICIAQGQNNNILVNTNYAGGRLLDILIIKDDLNGMNDLQPLQNNPNIIVSLNPNFGKFKLSFNLAYKDYISIEIYDVNGALIKNVQNERRMAKGNHQIQLNLMGIKQGFYYVSLSGDKTNVSQSVIVVGP
ncbi:MAG: hypothetical protein B7C24_06145 [Bacteroidetes bacterium 4572_77]|nr:MAG: hypothetical protein B7C24_06145 [Bacteroidetes bacterium 4572_77]